MLKFIILSVLFLSISTLPTHFGNTDQDLYENSQAVPIKRMMVTGCSSNSDFKYPNGSCLSTCPDPYKTETVSGSLFCNPPCADKYFDNAKNTCLDSCHPYFTRIENGLRYCDASTLCPMLDSFINPDPSCTPACSHPFLTIDLGDGTYDCQNPCSGQYYDVLERTCVESCDDKYIRAEENILYCDTRASSTDRCPKVFEFKYSNGSCLSSCPEPYSRGSTEEGYYTCTPPCSVGKYFDYMKWNCLNSCEEEYRREEDNISYCDVTTECSSVYDYRYANGSCLPTCPEPYAILNLRSGGYFCDVPCPSGYFNTENGEGCVNSCDGEVKTRGDILYCNKDSGESGSYSTTVGVYLRYDVSLAKFNYQGYFVKYIALLQSLLDDPKKSKIHIVNIKEGSTIIDSQVVLKSGSKSESESKGNAMMKKLQDAIESKGLNLEGISVLNHRFSVTTEDHGKSGKGVAIGLGVGLGAVAIVLGAFLIYRYQKKQKLGMVKEAKKKVQGKNERRDEEIEHQQAENGNVPGRIETEVNPLKVDGGDLDLDLEKNQQGEKEKGKIEEEEEKGVNERKLQVVGNDQQEKEN